MTFFIAITYERRAYYLKVERIFHDLMREQFRVSGKNKTIVVENDRPVWRSRGVNKHRIKWTLIEGHGYNLHVYDLIIRAIENAIE